MSTVGKQINVIHMLAHHVLIGPALPTPCRCLPTSADSLRAVATPPAVLSNRRPRRERAPVPELQARSPLHFNPSKSAPSPRRSSAIKRHGRAPRFARKGAGFARRPFRGATPLAVNIHQTTRFSPSKNMASLVEGVQKTPRLEKPPISKKGPSVFLGGSRKAICPPSLESEAESEAQG